MKKLLIQRATTGEGQFIRQIGFPRFGHVVLSVEPSSRSGLSFQWEVSPEQIPEMFRDAVRRGVSRMFEPGAKFDQYEPDGILIRVVGGSSHDTDSNEGSFEIAAMKAFVMALALALALPSDEATGLPGSSRG
ncbi:hypothetical protein [Variovorax sp. UC122_21]|uniref:hypothetical protein n=1 Tax=Variovorax sp. UC122_21 TaxID=3374554 RepID=UPI00375840CB